MAKLETLRKCTRHTRLVRGPLLGSPRSHCAPFPPVCSPQCGDSLGALTQASASHPLTQPSSPQAKESAHTARDDFPLELTVRKNFLLECFI